MVGNFTSFETLSDGGVTKIKDQTRAVLPGQMHSLGVLCGIAAGAWLGAAEAPTKLVTAGLSPYTISLCMVAGVFVARWTFPTLLRGTAYVFEDLLGKPHLIVWAILAGALWAVANTLTVFAIRDVGLSIAFPLWNTNSLIGILWGVLLFKELRGASAKNWGKVILGSVAIVVAATMLGISTIQSASVNSKHAVAGVAAALGASLMWGTMYVPYRKAYLSGMNPLSFVTAFTVGELGTVLALAIGLSGGLHSLAVQISAGAPFCLLAVSWRILLGYRRPLSAIRHQVHWNWPRHPAFEHQPALGTRLGRTGLRRTGRGRSLASAHRDCGFDHHDSRCSRDQYRGGIVRGAQIDKPGAPARVQSLQAGLQPGA